MNTSLYQADSGKRLLSREVGYFTANQDILIEQAKEN